MKMKRRFFITTILTGLCVIALAGCGNQTAEAPQENAQSANTNNAYDTAGGYGTSGISDSSVDAGDMLDMADLSGSVLGFSDNGCTVTPAKSIEGGAGMQISADGYENEDNSVTVNYGPDCQFVTAVLNGSSGSITSMTDCSASDVKKQSQIFAYGNYTDTYTFNADKIIIARYE